MAYIKAADQQSGIQEQKPSSLVARNLPMPLPSAVFLDTSIYAGQQYNFSSVALSSFVPIAIKHSLRVLLPDPTEREVVRQIQERSQEALKALDEARRRAPFLSKWKHFPPARASHSFSDWEVLNIALDEWNLFRRQLSMTTLDYTGVNLNQIMSWYDGIKPPFREGKKRKEFPDAFALAIVADYAATHECVVAVVSEDKDFMLSCERYSNLLYFSSLPKLTELFLAEPRAIDALKAAIAGDMDALEESLFSEAVGTEYVHSDDAYRIIRTKVHSSELTDVTIVGLGIGECTLTFEGSFSAEHLLRWTQWNEGEDEPDECQDWVSETHDFVGTAKVALASGTNRVQKVTYLDSDIWEAYVSEKPRNRWDR